MTPDTAERLFRAEVDTPPDLAEVTRLARTARRWGPLVRRSVRARLAARLAHAAFLAPDRVAEVYDAFARGWDGKPVDAPPVAMLDEAPLQAPEGFWDAYWTIARDGAAGKLDAILITTQTAALGGSLGEAYVARTARAVAAYPGVPQVANAPLPDRVTLDQLAACPDGSLGREFHDMIVDNQFDLEVLDRDAIGLSALPAPLDYLNTRILQAHDLWHIVAGYETTALHEIALSAFQLAQFGHPYSAHFLAVMAAVGTLMPGLGYPVLMTSILTAWRHGRTSPPLMAIDWESVWTHSADEIRRDYGIAAYDRPYPADLIEQRRAA